MKAVSLWQPWAQAITHRLKRNETRGWSTRYRGPLAIHAAKRWEKDQIVFNELLREHGLVIADLAFGAVVAVAWLVDVQPVEAMTTISASERLLGDYSPGRFAWILEDVQALREPLPFAGKQGFFDVPEPILAPLVPDWFMATKPC